jgi:phosphoribosyl-AMP cyclohydrolase / phosphoribosyl-ATP pyrophosphohydrolase
MLPFNLDALDFSKGGGLVTVVVQDAASGAVLMVAHADREAMERTVATGQMHFRSRSRGLWHKGATSGNVQQVISLTADCDADAVLARVVPAGPACHSGAPSCFGEQSSPHTLAAVDAVIGARAAELEHNAGAPNSDQHLTSYTRRLLTDRNLRLKKLGEEAAELVLACADEDRTRAIEEAADLFYHSLVALRATGATLTDVAAVLEARRK